MLNHRYTADFDDHLEAISKINSPIDLMLNNQISLFNLDTNFRTGPAQFSALEAINPSL
jgi:hypothetical protein